MVGRGGLEPETSGVPRISLRCTDLPPVPAARQLGLAADSDAGHDVGGSADKSGCSRSQAVYASLSQYRRTRRDERHSDD